MTATARFAVFVAISSLGCGAVEDDLGEPPRYPVPECAHLEQRPCDVRSTSCQTDLLALAACLRGEEPGELPPVTVMNGQELREYFRQVALEEEDPEPDHFERALAWLGLVRAGAFSDEAFVAEVAESVGGFYNNEDGRLVVVDRGDGADRDLDSVVLVHEFVHLLQDRDSDLASLEEHIDSEDSRLAVMSLVEGEAQLHHSRYLAAVSGLDPAAVDWEQFFQNGIERGEREIRGVPSPYVASSRVFPYAWGARYVRLVREQGGLSSVLERFAAPPRTTRALMATTTELADDLPAVPIAEPTPAAGWLPAGDTTLGAWGVYLLLQRVGADTARRLALAWRGDGFFLYENATISPVATGLVWRLEFADAASATEVMRWLPADFEREGLARRDANRLVIALQGPELPLEWGFEP